MLHFFFEMIKLGIFKIFFVNFKGFFRYLNKLILVFQFLESIVITNQINKSADF